MKLKLNFISNSHDFLTTEQALFDPEYQVFDDNELVNTYFSIRNDKGAVLGSNYDDIEKPLDIILSIEYQDLSYILPNEIA